jgi:hypothetical protein
VIDELRRLNPDRLSPEESARLLRELKRRATSDDAPEEKSP